MKKTILMIGAFDTKGDEYAFLREQIISRGHTVLSLNTGVMGRTEQFPVDVEADQIVEAAGDDLSALRTRRVSDKNYEVLVFHATGMGGRTMEALIGKIACSLLAILAGLVACSPATLHAAVFDLSPQSSTMTAYHCTTTSETDVLQINTTGTGVATLEWALTDAVGPAVLQFRMKTRVVGDYGEYVVYWVGEASPDWVDFRRIPFHADGSWHEYCIPLAAGGAIRALRLTFGSQRHDLEISSVQLHRVTFSPPAQEIAETADLPESVQTCSGGLSCRLNCHDRTYQIHDARTGRTWRSEPISKWLALTAVKKLREKSLLVEMFDIFARQPLSTSTTIDASVVTFSIESPDPESPIDAASQFPPRFATDFSDGHLVFCDRSCGVLLHQADPTYAHWPLRVYGNTHCLDMPWVGVFDDRLGDGVMLLVESPADAEVAFVKGADGRHWPEVRWLPSMDSFGYRRTVSYRFTSSGRYVALAKSYRRYVKQQGRLKTLFEKATSKPNVDRLRGAPSLWGARSPTRFIKQMRPLGIRRGIVNTCHDAAVVAWLNKLGFLTGTYDSYTDITEGPTGFQRDDVEQTAVRSRPGGAPKLGWKKQNGEQMFWRSSAAWRKAEDSYVDRDLKRFKHNARFVDVAAAAELLEDYHPQHTIDRRQDLANRRALYQRLNERGLVLGTEHGNDWVVDKVDYLEGSMSGPFWWSSWPAGYLETPTREQLTLNYLKFGMGYANRIPLWELVYHDCVQTTWYWGDTAGLLYQSAPDLADRKDLFNMLYGTTPLIWINDTGYKLPSQVHRMLKTYHDTCPLQEVVAFEEMLDHEFLSEDRAVQRTQFANGTTIVVNFSDEPRPYNAGGETIMLAASGYYIKGPGISQTRLSVGGSPQTIISKPGYLTVESDGTRFVANVRCRGRLTALKITDNRWNLFMEPNRECELNICAITNWNGTDDLRVYQMNELAENGKQVTAAGETGSVRFKSNENAWRFVVVRES